MFQVVCNMLDVKIAGKDYASDKITYPKLLKLEISHDFAQEIQRSSLLVSPDRTSVALNELDRLYTQN